MLIYLYAFPWSCIIIIIIIMCLFWTDSTFLFKYFAWHKIKFSTCSISTSNLHTCLSFHIQFIYKNVHEYSKNFWFFFYFYMPIVEVCLCRVHFTCAHNTKGNRFFIVLFAIHFYINVHTKCDNIVTFMRKVNENLACLKH